MIGDEETLDGHSEPLLTWYRYNELATIIGILADDAIAQLVEPEPVKLRERWFEST